METSSVKKHTACQSDIGKKRHNNEDAAYAAMTQYGSLLVVADGMGGHRKGEVASKFVVDSLAIPFASLRRPLSSGGAKKLVRKCVKKANKAIYKMSFSNGDFEEMGTTAVAAFRTEDDTYVLSVGDSRCYSYSDETGLVRQTIDQSYVELLYENGRISKSEISTHPQKNMLINAVGINPDLSDIQEKTLANDSYTTLLLCSDGLYNMVSEEEIAHVLAEKNQTPEEKADQLIQKALEAGGNDNVAVALYED
jgi:serine/threonine protein phosphatase PrpC